MVLCALGMQQYAMHNATIQKTTFFELGVEVDWELCASWAIGVHSWKEGRGLRILVIISVLTDWNFRGLM